MRRSKAFAIRRCAAVMFLLAATCDLHAGRPAATFTAVFDDTFEHVADAVHQVAKDGVIRGSSQYAGEKEITGAEFAPRCSLFGGAPDGTVFYKVRERVLSPSTFVNSNDIGTLAVRYVVRAMDGNKTRVIIDAVFVEDSHHMRHASEGAVEISEYAGVTAKLKALAEERAQTQAVLQRNEIRHTVEELQRTLRDEGERSERLEFQVQQLRNQRDQLRRQLSGTVRGAEAYLREAPYTHAAALRSLKPGEQVDILDRTAYWFRVRSADGREGWLYRSSLEGVE